MRPRLAIDRLELVSNGAGALGALALFALVLAFPSPSPSVETPADPGAATMEIALDAPAEPEQAEPPAPEPPQDAPMETPEPAVVEDTPPPLPEPAPIVAPPKPPPPERPKPKTPEKRQRTPERASEKTRDKPAAATAHRGEPSESARPSRASGNVATFRACLAGAPYPSSKDARLQKPSGSVGIAVSGGSASVIRSSGSAILDQAARSRAVACASAAGGGTLSGVVAFHPR